MGQAVLGRGGGLCLLLLQCNFARKRLLLEYPTEVQSLQLVEAGQVERVAATVLADIFAIRSERISPASPGHQTRTTAFLLKVSTTATR